MQFRFKGIYILWSIPILGGITIKPLLLLHHYDSDLNYILALCGKGSFEYVDFDPVG